MKTYQLLSYKFLSIHEKINYKTHFNTFHLASRCVDNVVDIKKQYSLISKPAR